LKEAIAKFKMILSAQLASHRSQKYLKQRFVWLSRELDGTDKADLARRAMAAFALDTRSTQFDILED
jgi:hypothetical protein